MDEIDEIRYSEMLWNTPLSPAHADRLLQRLGVTRARTVLDLGCGWGELLLRAVAAASPECVGTGVDDDAALLQRGRRTAGERRLDDRVSFVAGDATSFQGGADVVLCIGAAHAWGGAVAALGALRASVPVGGRLLFGDGVWLTAPGEDARALFGDDVLVPAELERAATAAGWELVDVSPTSQDEFDAFEASFRAGRERWAATHPDDPRAAGLAAEMAQRREEYESVYRGVLGFTYLVLRPTEWS